MPQMIRKNLPTPSDVHIDAPLTNMSLGFMQSADAFVATKVFPVLPSAKQSDKFFTYDRSYWYRSEMKKRGPSTESAGGGYALSNDNYFCDVYALHKDVDDDTRGNADSIVAPDEEAADWLSQQALLNLEKQWTTAFFKTTVWTTDKTVATKWDDPSSNPVDDCEAGVTTIIGSTGIDPSRIKLTLGYQVWEKLKHHPDLVDRIKYGQAGAGSPATVTPAAIAAVLGIGEVLVARAIENTAKEGQTATYAFIGGKNALLSYAPERPGRRTASAGYTMMWTGRVGANAMGSSISRFRMDNLKSDRFEIEQAFDQKLTAKDLGYFFTSVVA